MGNPGIVVQANAVQASCPLDCHLDALATFFGSIELASHMIEHLFQVVPIFLPQGKRKREIDVNQLMPHEIAEYRRLFEEYDYDGTELRSFEYDNDPYASGFCFSWRTYICSNPAHAPHFVRFCVVLRVFKFS